MKQAKKRTLSFKMKNGIEYVLEFPTEQECMEAKEVLDRQIRAKKGAMYI